MTLPDISSPFWVYLALAPSALFSVIMVERDKRREARLAIQTPTVVQGIEPEIEEDAVEQLSLLDAIAKRDKVLDEVADSNSKWMDYAVPAMYRLEEGRTGIGEDFRNWLTEAGVPAPRSPNAWGSLFMTMTKRGVLVKTGEYRPMKDPKSNGRSSAVYRKVRAA